MCVGENTSQAASVGVARRRRSNPARGRLLFSRKRGTATFATVSKTADRLAVRRFSCLIQITPASTRANTTKVASRDRANSTNPALIRFSWVLWEEGTTPALRMADTTGG